MWATCAGSPRHPTCSPGGRTAIPASRGRGPRGHQAIWNTYRQAFQNSSGEPFYELQWWFNGVLATDKIKLTDFGKGQGGYYKALTESCGRPFPGTDLKWETVAANSSTRLRELMEQGYAVAIGIRRLDENNKILPVWHMLSLWGVEFDEETQQVTAVYLTDSNDSDNALITTLVELKADAAVKR